MSPQKLKNPLPTDIQDHKGTHLVHSPSKMGLTWDSIVLEGKSSPQRSGGSSLRHRHATAAARGHTPGVYKDGAMSGILLRGTVLGALMTHDHHFSI